MVEIDPGQGRIVPREEYLPQREHLEFVSGDIFSQGVQVLVNPVNCVGTSGGGLAKAFKERFPQNHRAYHAACKRGELASGRIFVVQVGGMDTEKTGYIFNLPTKDHWRDRSTLGMVADGLLALVDLIAEYRCESIAVPALGCGLGGLKWMDVKRMMHQTLGSGLFKRMDGNVTCRVVVMEPR